MKYNITRNKQERVFESPKYGDKVFVSCINGDYEVSNWLTSKPMVVESALRNDVVVLYDRKPATLYIVMKTGVEEWTEVGQWELRKGTRRSIIIRDLEKKYSKKVPDIGDECLVVIEGVIFKAEVTKLDHRQAQFDVIFGESQMFNIPYAKFRPV